MLVVDDERHVREVMPIGLRRLGYRVDAVENAAEVSPRIKATQGGEEAFKIVISDQTMPVMTGLQLLAHIKTNARETPVILMTGYSDSLNKTGAMAAGAADFLRKPLDARKLADVVGLVLDGEMQNLEAREPIN